MIRTAQERLDAKRKILGDDECWPWTGGQISEGYGAFRYQGKNTTAHRAVFEMVHGYVPLHVLHRCNNKLCTNPRHLYPGNARLNVIHAIHDGLTKVRKLTIDEVPTIRALHVAGARAKEIADRFGVSVSHVRMIIKGRRWGHVGTNILDGVRLGDAYAMAA
jgi:hypothetical protein